MSAVGVAAAAGAAQGALMCEPGMKPAFSSFIALPATSIAVMTRPETAIMHTPTDTLLPVAMTPMLKRLSK